MTGDLVTVFLCGDVMLGRGVDQVLPHPGDPALAEAYVSDARTYVRLAEAAYGPVPRPAPYSWPWGVALDVLDAAAPDVRVLNLETSVTRGGERAVGKGIHYRMHPGNLPALTAVRPDVCALANNHVLDFGRPGLTDTLDALDALGAPGSSTGAGVRRAGAGRDAAEAWAPAVVPLPGGRRLLVLACGTASSGVPRDWAATARRSGVARVDEPLDPARPAAVLRAAKRPGDLAVVSVHWGGNWGYGVSGEQRRFAHALVDAGADVVHGHSSHHPRPLEAYRGALVLYGCGDLVNDYEGISGHEEYRDDLRLLYLVSLAADGAFRQVRMVPLRARRLRLEHAPNEGSAWLQRTLAQVSGRFGVQVARERDGTLTARPQRAGARPERGRPEGGSPARGEGGRNGA
ncbi:CapA family protein [Streptomyces sp. NPDC017979]|uniref:CapA family protein n=1 Tax=Streptomyces sp. NPDC017979 TaxID=3365024 RepID=UPI003793DCE3